MHEITYTLLSDGTSDKALLPIINWTIQHYFPESIIQPQWADLSRLPQSPPTGLLEKRIQLALAYYPCDWLFVHRDAEKQAVSVREQEILKAWQLVGQTAQKQLVHIIPVRMTEAWLLFDEWAIRKAASNPSGTQVLKLPPLRALETLPDPKEELKNLLRQASGLTGRRLQKFSESRAIQLVAENIVDYSPLRGVAAYAAFESAIRQLRGL